MRQANDLDLLARAVELSPDNLPLRCALAARLHETGSLPEAADQYAEVLRRDPASRDARLGLARVDYARGRVEETVATLRAPGVGLESVGEAQLLLARALLAQELLDEARACYRKALDLDPGLADDDLAQDLEGPKRVPIPVDNGEAAPADLSVPVEKAGIRFADVGGLEELKKTIVMRVIEPFRRPELYRAYRRSAGGGILLYGPPGCGKTMIARATAGECGAAFITIAIDDVLDMYLGNSEKRIHAIFHEARRRAPTVIFIDEVEALAASRLKMDRHYHRTLVNQFLSEMDGIASDNKDVLVMGATNAPWHMDNAFLRPGRFDRIIFVPPPDLPARVEILRLKSEGRPLERVDFTRVAQATPLFSGADLAAICDRAADAALADALKDSSIRPLTTRDYLQAAGAVKASTLEWLDTARNFAKYANVSGLYDDLKAFLEANHRQ